LFLKIPNIDEVLTSIGTVLLSIDAVLASIVVVLTLLRTFRAFAPYLKKVLPVAAFILSRSTDSITYRSSHGMLPEKRGDVFRRSGYSSHFYADYPKSLLFPATIRTFAASNRKK
jgi:hypothetical protein